MNFFSLLSFSFLGFIYIPRICELQNAREFNELYSPILFLSSLRKNGTDVGERSNLISIIKINFSAMKKEEAVERDGSRQN